MKEWIVDQVIRTRWVFIFFSAFSLFLLSTTVILATVGVATGVLKDIEADAIFDSRVATAVRETADPCGQSVFRIVRPDGYRRQAVVILAGRIVELGSEQQFFVVPAGKFVRFGRGSSDHLEDFEDLMYRPNTCIGYNSVDAPKLQRRR